MGVTYGFYNAINSDRKYNAVQMSELFDGLIEDGVYLSIGDAFAVTERTVPDLSVQVGEGRAWFKHTWTYNDSHLILNIETPDILFPRIDSVVLEVDRSEAVRANTIKVIKGTPSATPVEPTMQHTSTLDQYRIANINVAANETQILNADITYKVGTVETPFVAGVLSSFDVETLLAQWDSYFDNTWLPARETEMENTWWPAFQVQLDAIFDAWMATLDDPIPLKSRQGGDPDHWDHPGSNNYDPINFKSEVGSIQIQIPDGQDYGLLSFNFPVPFANPPLVFLQTDIQHVTTSVTINSGSNIYIYVYRPGTQGNQFVKVFWMAIGPA